MSTRCTICSHPSRIAIDADVRELGSVREAAAKWSVSESALYRHRAAHTSASMLAVLDAEDSAPPSNYLRVLDSALADAGRLAAFARATGQAGLLLRALNTEAAIAGNMLSRYGVDDRRVVADLTEHAALLRGLLAVAQSGHTAALDVLADELDSRGQPERAADLRETAAAVQKKSLGERAAA